MYIKKGAPLPRGAKQKKKQQCIRQLTMSTTRNMNFLLNNFIDKRVWIYNPVQTIRSSKPITIIPLTVA